MLVFYFLLITLILIMDLKEFASKEELFFDLWLQPMLKHKVILLAKYQPKSFELTCSKHTAWIEPKKRSVKEHEVTLLNSHKYTADWYLVWNPEYKDRMFVCWTDILTGNPHKSFPFIVNYKAENNRYFSVIDIKGSFVAQGNSSGITFPLNQKWVMANHNIYVQKVIPEPSLTKTGRFKPSNALFPNTFAPNHPDYLLTEKKKEPRKIKFPIITFDEYIKTI